MVRHKMSFLLAGALAILANCVYAAPPHSGGSNIEAALQAAIAQDKAICGTAIRAASLVQGAAMFQDMVVLQAVIGDKLATLRVGLPPGVAHDSVCGQRLVATSVLAASLYLAKQLGMGAAPQGTGGPCEGDSADTSAAADNTRDKPIGKKGYATAPTNCKKRDAGKKPDKSTFLFNPATAQKMQT